MCSIQKVRGFCCLRSKLELGFEGSGFVWHGGGGFGVDKKIGHAYNDTILKKLRRE